MTYALAWPLQRALFALLSGDPAVTAETGGRIHDAAPDRSEGPAGLHVLIGEERAADWSTATDAGAEHRVTISVVAEGEGYGPAKRAAAAICDAIAPEALSLERGRVVTARFLAARTARERKGAVRRIDLTFRIVVEDDPDA